MEEFFSPTAAAPQLQSLPIPLELIHILQD